jgi:hypothetical protein
MFLSSVAVAGSNQKKRAIALGEISLQSNFFLVEISILMFAWLADRTHIILFGGHL